MPADALVEALPDLLLLVRRDGMVLGHGGGNGVAGLRPPGDYTGKLLEALWSESTARVLRQLVRKAITQRMTTELRFRDAGEQFEARVTARGPDRAICVIRAVQAASQTDSVETTGGRHTPALDRRGFLERFRESASWAALREKSLAVAVIQLEGIPEIAQLIAGKISEQIMSAAIVRLSAQLADAAHAQPSWYLGQLSESLLALVVHSSDRNLIDECVSRVCASLREPVDIGDAEFHLTPCAGVAILGQDASSPRVLLDHSRAAAAEARRRGSAQVHFFSDSMSLRSLARLDMARELREAISNGDIGLRYVGRHDLETGRLVTRVAYLRWLHPLRGEIRPAEFVRVAEATGLATALSRAVLARLREDFLTFDARHDPDVRISFGALRHHVLHEDFVDDLARFLAENVVPAERLELRIAEKAFVAREPAHFNSLRRLGVQLVVDEVGRGMGSLQRLARAPIWGLQLDRAWVTALRSDEVARKVCRAGISVATALGLTPIATGVDDQAQRDALLALGCRYGMGDLYIAAGADITAAVGGAASA